MVVGLSEKVDSSISTAITSQYNTSGPVILQLISTKIPSDYVDIALIRKCNTIDIPALQSALKTCEKSLLKYFSFLDVDNS